MYYYNFNNFSIVCFYTVYETIKVLRCKLFLEILLDQ